MTGTQPRVTHSLKSWREELAWFEDAKRKLRWHYLDVVFVIETRLPDSEDTGRFAAPQAPTLRPYANGDELVADMGRHCRIVEAALVAAEARDDRPPLSGMPGCEEFNRRALAAAGETYTIDRGVKVPLTP